MGQKQVTARTSLDVGDPLHVQHTAQLKLDPRRGIVLQVPELDAFLAKEGVPFSDRETWDVLRFVYQAGGLELVKNTLHLIREQRPNVPPPDYDLTSTGSSTTSNSPSTDSRRNWSSHEEDNLQQKPRVSIDSGSTRGSNRRSIDAGLRRNSSKKTESPPLLLRAKTLGSDAVLSEAGEEWRSARSSVYETQEITVQWVRDSPIEEHTPDFIRPASKVWKRAMAPEVHADLVRALKVRESQDERLREVLLVETLETKKTHTILETDVDMNG